jgi:L-lactate dehydrogenase complex protein LldG
MVTIDEAAVELFRQKAVPVSIQVTDVKDIQGAMEYAIDVCDKKDFCELLLSDPEKKSSSTDSAHPVRATVKTLAAPNLDDALFAELQSLGDKKNFTVLRSGMRDHLAGVDVTLTTADKAIAETATCVLRSMSEDVRLATMVGEIHVIALKKSQIVNTSYDAEEFLHELMTQGSAYTAFISGPSRTADIERVLTLGVHGPLELHIALMEG